MNKMDAKKRCCDQPYYELEKEVFELNDRGTKMVVVRIYQCVNCGNLERAKSDQENPKWK